MAYIGIDPNVGDITFQRFTGDGSTTAFTLAQSVASGEAIIVSVGNVIQEPGASASYTAYGTTLTFSEAPANTDDIVVRYFGRAVDQPLSYAMQLFKFVATASQTVFTGADNAGAILAFSGNDVDVYLNGVHLDTADYTPSNGDTITLASGAALNDELVIRAFRAFTVTDTVSKASGGTFGGGVTVNGDLTVDTSTLKVDSTNNRVGVGTASPASLLHIASTANPTISLEDTDNGFAASTILVENGGRDLKVTTPQDTIFVQGASEKVRIDSDGLKFNGDTAAANALDDYEEGTWTPVVRGSSTAGTYTTTTTYAKYTKVGKVVTASAYLGNITQSSAGGGYVQITGLPFAKEANHYVSGACWIGQWNYPSTVRSFAIEGTSYASSTSTFYIHLGHDNAGNSNLLISELVNGSSDIGLTVTYFTS